MSQKLPGMSYTELNHPKEKDPEVAKTYHHLINKFYTFGPIKIEPKKKHSLSNRLGFAGVLQEKITLIWKYILTVN